MPCLQYHRPERQAKPLFGHPALPRNILHVVRLSRRFCVAWHGILLTSPWSNIPNPLLSNRLHPADASVLGKHFASLEEQLLPLIPLDERRRLSAETYVCTQSWQQTGPGTMTDARNHVLQFLRQPRFVIAKPAMGRRSCIGRLASPTSFATAKAEKVCRLDFSSSETLATKFKA